MIRDFPLLGFNLFYMSNDWSTWNYLYRIVTNLTFWGATRQCGFFFSSFNKFITDRKGAPFNSLWRKKVCFCNWSYFYRKRLYCYCRRNWNRFHILLWDVNLLTLWHLNWEWRPGSLSELHCICAHSINYKFWVDLWKLIMVIGKENNG